jgi:hypothetical protein
VEDSIHSKRSRRERASVKKIKEDDSHLKLALKAIIKDIPDKDLTPENRFAREQWTEMWHSKCISAYKHTATDHVVEMQNKFLLENGKKYLKRCENYHLTDPRYCFQPTQNHESFIYKAAVEYLKFVAGTPQYRPPISVEHDCSVGFFARIAYSSGMPTIKRGNIWMGYTGNAKRNGSNREYYNMDEVGGNAILTVNKNKFGIAKEDVVMDPSGDSDFGYLFLGCLNHKDADIMMFSIDVNQKDDPFAFVVEDLASARKQGTVDMPYKKMGKRDAARLAEQTGNSHRYMLFIALKELPENYVPVWCYGGNFNSEIAVRLDEEGNAVTWKDLTFIRSL